MQEKRKETFESEVQYNIEPVSSGDKSTAQQSGRQGQAQKSQASWELREMDQQEGSMNNGTLGGNFDASDQNMDYVRNSPPY